MNKIQVSICCITYNQAKYIRQTLESFLMQKTNFAYEILVHDDASTDGTQEIIKEYEKKYPNIIKPIYQLENQYSKGVSVSELNFIRAKGKYLAFCEGDDYWTDSNKLQKQFDYMEEHGDCGLCFHGVAKLNDKNKKIVGKISPSKHSQKFLTKDIILGGGGFLGTNSIFCKSSLLQNLPSFYKKCKVGDYPLQLIMVADNYAYFMNEIMSVYRINVLTSWSNRNKRKSIGEAKIEKNNLYRNLIDMLKEYDKYTYKKYSATIYKKIRIFEMEIFINDGEIKKIFSEEYKNEYKMLCVGKRVKGILNYFLPNFTGILVKLLKIIISKIKGYDI